MRERRIYDSANRISRITVAPVDPSTSQWVPSLDLEYTYLSGEGHLASETDHLRTDSVTYSYDNMARLTTAQASSGIWGVSMRYDAFGNRTGQQPVKGVAPTRAAVAQIATNHLLDPSISYDANGNITAMPQLSLSYDVENRLATAVHVVNGTDRYGYTPSNQRFWLSTSIGSDTVEEVYLYGMAGELLATYKLNSDSDNNLALTLISMNMYLQSRLIQSRGEVVVTDRLNAVRAWGSRSAGTRATRYLPKSRDHRLTPKELPRQSIGTTD